MEQERRPTFRFRMSRLQALVRYSQFASMAVRSNRFASTSRGFTLADVVLMLDIYPAGESPIEGITTPALIDKIKSFGHKDAMYAASAEMIESYVIGNAREGDAVIVMGAGSVTKLADVLSAR